MRNRRFNHLIKPEKYECCNPTSLTCVVTGNLHEPVFFEVQFKWKQQDAMFRIVECVSEGELFLQGSVEDVYAECVTAESRVVTPLEEYTIPI
ncbi:hypothetical protein BDB01DRAFT_853583 [Pilobolus umbonatus]|nr:hypothetical protein BDB01DRAFT_853583 [Pilobolus umbonatus]